MARLVGRARPASRGPFGIGHVDLSNARRESHLRDVAAADPASPNTPSAPIAAVCRPCPSCPPRHPHQYCARKSSIQKMLAAPLDGEGNPVRLEPSASANTPRLQHPARVPVPVAQDASRAASRIDQQMIVTYTRLITSRYLPAS